MKINLTVEVHLIIGIFCPDVVSVGIILQRTGCWRKWFLCGSRTMLYYPAHTNTRWTLFWDKYYFANNLLNYDYQTTQNKPGVGESWYRSALCWSEMEPSVVRCACSLLRWRLASPELLLLQTWPRSWVHLSGRHNTLLPLGRTSRLDTREARQVQQNKVRILITFYETVNHQLALCSFTIMRLTDLQQNAVATLVQGGRCRQGSGDRTRLRAWGVLGVDPPADLHE